MPWARPALTDHATGSRAFAPVWRCRPFNAGAPDTGGNSEVYGTITVLLFLTTPFAIIITKKISEIIANKIHLINYEKTSIFILIFLITITFVFSGLTGLLILITSTIIGVLTIKKEVSKTILMSSIIIPSLFYYLPI